MTGFYNPNTGTFDEDAPTHVVTSSPLPPVKPASMGGADPYSDWNDTTPIPLPRNGMNPNQQTGAYNPLNGLLSAIGALFHGQAVPSAGQGMSGLVGQHVLKNSVNRI